MYTVIDLFSGAGGLSQGFKQAGFDIKAAFEKSDSAKATYRKNFPGVAIYDDVINADYHALQKKYGAIDVVIGGPPCQGFSNANRQHNQAISLNNKLVKEYVRAILEIHPKAFVMENVGSLKSDVHRFYMETSDVQIAKRYSIKFSDDSILLLPAEIDFPEALFVAETPALVDRLIWEDNDFHCLRILNRQRNNIKKLKAALKKYKRLLTALAQRLKTDSTGFLRLDLIHHQFADTIIEYSPNDDVPSSLLSCVTYLYAIQQMLQRLKEIQDNDIIVERIERNEKEGLQARVHSCAVSHYIESILKSQQVGYDMTSGIMNAAGFGVPQKRMRFIILGVLKSLGTSPITMPGEYFSDSVQYQSVYDAIHDLESVPANQDKDDPPIVLCPYEFKGDPVAKRLRDSNVLYNHFCTATRETALKRFAALKEGENFHNLADDMKTTYTKAERTQNTIYLRLVYDQPSGTVVNVRKSMWIHPKIDRALTVREAARLQSFPDHFRFMGSKDQQYQQVGNAVPPILAQAIADHIKAKLDEVDDGR